MIHSAIQRLQLRGLLHASRVSVGHRLNLPVCRGYADKKLPPNSNDSSSSAPASDYIPSQTPLSNPEMPQRCMSHQTQKDVVSGKIFGEELSTRADEGLPVDGVVVDNVIYENRQKLQKDAEDIRQNGTAETIGEADVAGSQVEGRRGINHITKESLACEQIVSGGDESEATKRSPGDKAPTSAVPTKVAAGDGEKPAVTNASLKNINDLHPTPGGHVVRTNGGRTSAMICEAEQFPESTEPMQKPRKSILHLFGPETTPKERATPNPQPVSQPKVNPLEPHRLDGSNTDLLDWEKSIKYDSQRNTEVDELKVIEGGKLESKRESESQRRADAHAQDVATAQRQVQLRRRILQNFNNMPKPQSRGISLDVPLLSLSDGTSPSPWDYFYPPQQASKSLTATLEDQAGSQKFKVSDAIKEPVYNPYEHKKKHVRWPFMYNRDQLLELCTNHLMRDGKKARAEKILQDMFLELLEHYPRRHPVTLLAEALDRTAPILKTLSSRVGLKVTTTPVALFEKQRIRLGWNTLIKAASNDTKPIQAREHITPFSGRLAREVIKVIEGKGAGLAHRIAEHRKAMLNKLNVKLPRRKAFQ